MLRKWKSYEKAFPDMDCECMKGMMIPTRCKKCGADRTKDNWESNQSKEDK